MHRLQPYSRTHGRRFGKHLLYLSGVQKHSVQTLSDPGSSAFTHIKTLWTSLVLLSQRDRMKGFFWASFLLFFSGIIGASAFDGPSRFFFSFSHRHTRCLCPILYLYLVRVLIIKFIVWMNYAIFELDMKLSQPFRDRTESIQPILLRDWRSEKEKGTYGPGAWRWRTMTIWWTILETYIVV